MTRQDQIEKVFFGVSKDEVTEDLFYKFVTKRKLETENNCMHKFYFKNENLVAYYLHGSFKNNYYIVNNDVPGIGGTKFNVVLAPFEYIAGFDDYKEKFTPSGGLFAQLKKGKVFEYKELVRGITKRDITLVYILLYGDYEMPYTKNRATTEEDLDIEVEHFYFLNKYNLL